MKFQVDIRPRGLQSAFAFGPFDDAYTALKDNGYRIISLAENAQLRIQEGKNHPVSQDGTWVLEDAVYIPGKGNFLTRNSPINSNSKRATQSNRKGKEFYLTKSQVESALVNSVKLPESITEIPTDRFGEEELTVFAFGGSKQAQVYGDFLNQADILQMPVYVPGKNWVSQESRPFARKVWFGELCGVRSYLNCNHKGLYFDVMLRGVLDSSSAK